MSIANLRTEDGSRRILRSPLRPSLRTVTKWSTLVSGAMLLVVLTFFLPASLHYHQSSQWPTTTGVVSATGLKLYMHKPERAPVFTPTVYYAYTVGGVSRVSAQIDFEASVRVMPQEEGTHWLANNYPVGTAVTVYYDPADPDSAVLRPGAEQLVTICNWWIAATAGCCLVSAVLWCSAARRVKAGLETGATSN